jgi:hypothetical protein
MAEGFRARNPSLVVAADALLAKLETHAVGTLAVHTLYAPDV